MSKQYAIIHISAPPDVKAKLEKLAKRKNLSQTQVIINLINNAVIREEEKRMKKIDKEEL